MKVSYRLILIVFCFRNIVSAQTEGIVKWNGTEIHYRSFGAGRPILIINGGPGMNSNGFEMPAIKLAENYRTIIFDQRGTGASRLDTVDPTTITMDLMVSDIEQLRQTLRIERWIVLGHSFGGMLASYYAAKHPEKIDALILSSSGGIDLDLLSYARGSIISRLSRSELDSMRYWEDQIEDGDTSYHARYRRGLALAPAYTVHRTNVPRLADRLTQGNRRINDLVWEDLRRIKFNCATELSAFKKPVLIIQGKQDIISERTALRVRNVLPHSIVVILENCGHYGWLDNERDYFSSIETFLTSIN